MSGGKFSLHTKPEGQANYKDCLSVINFPIDYDGFILVIASNGNNYADYVRVHSVEAFDPSYQDQENVIIFPFQY